MYVSQNLLTCIFLPASPKQLSTKTSPKSTSSAKPTQTSDAAARNMSVICKKPAVYQWDVELRGSVSTTTRSRRGPEGPTKQSIIEKQIHYKLAIFPSSHSSRRHLLQSPRS